MQTIKEEICPHLIFDLRGYHCCAIMSKGIARVYIQFEVKETLTHYSKMPKEEKENLIKYIVRRCQKYGLQANARARKEEMEVNLYARDFLES